MKKLLPGIIILFLALNLSAKKVKFAVDMTGQTVSLLGVHVVGDFQVAAGYALDWDPTLTTLTQEGSSDIYSIIVDIPAFRKYEYRFVNGDQTYEAEFVPDESRVGYNFIDNRWMFVDSLKNDTTFVGAILFGGNAPAGLNLVRYRVDMTNATASAFGVHVAANYNSFSPTATRLYSFAENPMPNVYEIINYVIPGTYAFNFVNGKTSGDTEPSVPGSCSSAGIRSITITKDTVFPEICFNHCSTCAVVSVKEITKTTDSFKAYPNPASNHLFINSERNTIITSLSLTTIAGQTIWSVSGLQVNNYAITNLDLPKGLYLLTINDQSKQQQHIKITID